jgi:hypothetical protein
MQSINFKDKCIFKNLQARASANKQYTATVTITSTQYHKERTGIAKNPFTSKAVNWYQATERRERTVAAGSISMEVPTPKVVVLLSTLPGTAAMTAQGSFRKSFRI